MIFDNSRTYRCFLILNYVFLAVMGFLSLIPLIHIFAVSLSGRAPAEANFVGLLPIDLTTAAYAETLNNARFGSALLNGFIRTITGTILSLVVIIPAAYALSKDRSEFRSRNLYAYYFLFAMLFSGGLIPSYVVVKQVGLMNSLGALILPTAVNVWNLILLMNFFRANVPKTLAEAALIDGATHLQILLRVFLPLSLPAIATVGLFTMVFHWNAWFDGMIYITDSSRVPLATFLQSVIVQQDYSRLNNPNDIVNITTRTVKAAQIFIAIIPVLIAYPFLQRFFVRGLVLGAIKE